MANDEHLAILEQGVEVWNKWKQQNLKIFPNLSSVDLSGANLGYMDLSDTNLSGANLISASLRHADLGGTFLRRTILSDADLFSTDLSCADLSGADLGGADLSFANFSGAILQDTNFANALLNNTIFAENNLSVAAGLDSVTHYGPSTIGIDTLYESGGNIPESFLRGCGVPDDFIAFIPSHFGIRQAIQFYSCFISYSTKDEDFARRLYSKMRDEKLRVWFAPEDIKGGQKLHEQLERAIHLHDRLLIVLSEESMKSQWVQTEIRKAREIEIAESRRKLFPIMLVDYEAVKKWKCFDADTGKDLAVELREYYIQDFSNWKDHDSFEREFEKLLRDLKAEEK